MTTSALPKNADDANNSRNGLPFCLWVVLIGLAGFFGYQQLFSTFASYDDEGYVMLSLQNFMQGHPLYDETYSQYGPAFFQIQYYLHDLFELEISHDVMRFKTLCLWMLVSLLSATVVWQITKKAWFAVAAFGVVFPHLDRLSLEPGHPQELCALCLIGVLGISASIDFEKTGARANGRVRFGVIGGLIAVVLLTKINVGLILGLPLALAMLVGSPDSGLRRLLLSVALLASFGLLGMIGYQTGFRLTTSLLPLIVAIGLVAAVLTSVRLQPVQQIDYRQIVYALFGFLFVIGWVLVIALLKRTTISGLTEGIVFQHLGFGNFFFSPAPIHPIALTAGVCGLLLAIAARFGSSNAANVGRLLITLLLFGSALTAVVQSFSVPETGFDDRGLAGLLVSLATGLCWVILVPLKGSDSVTSTVSFGRVALCFAAVFQPIAAYPTPGTQMAVGSFLLVLVGLIAFSDLVEEKVFATRSSGHRPSVHWSLGVLCLIVLSTMLIRSVDLGVKRSNMVWLDLPGALRLRLPENQVNAIKSVVEKLDRDSDTFIFAENNRNSFYFWTGKRPPTAINATAWPFMLKSEQQLRIIGALEQYDRVLVVRDRVEWPLPNDAPLVQWIDTNFEFDSTQGPYDIWSSKTENTLKDAVFFPGSFP